MSRWSVQEIRRVVVRLAQRGIEPRHVHRLVMLTTAHQAAGKHAHVRSRTQL